ncbi:MAG: hypothetical protein LQ345_000659 [Seirophora villosa]|nr:MAG: hypothetical protein LQ345_000659 [Seirophora villosa]
MLTSKPPPDYGGGYSTTSYGAQGGMGGGGFMGGSQGGSQPTAGKGTLSKDTLRPCTIKQVLEASQPFPDAEFKIDEVEVQQLTFVGQIRNISTQTTNITYKLDDGTGSVEVKQWVDVEANSHAPALGLLAAGGGGGAGDGKKPSSPLKEGEWARVWGRLKAFNNRRHVGAHVIRPVTDKMEITYHLLEATYVHLYFTKGPLEPGAGRGAAGAGGGMNAQADGGYGNGDMGMRPDMKTLHVGVNARRVYQCLKEIPQSNEGLHVQNIAASIKMPVTDVMKAGDELLANSLIFTTVDDSTWALLEF